MKNYSLAEEKWNKILDKIYRISMLFSGIGWLIWIISVSSGGTIPLFIQIISFSFTSLYLIKEYLLGN